MTGSVNIARRKPGRRVSFPEIFQDPGPAAASAIVSRRFEVTLAGRTAILDLTRLTGRLPLARSFARALWHACQVGGPAGSVRTADGFVDGLRCLWRYFDATRSDVQALEDIDVASIDGFDAWMDTSGLHPNNRLHQMGHVLRLLRLAEVAEPGRLTEATSRRLLYTSDRPGVPARPRDAYSDGVAASLKAAARADVAAIMRRFSTPPEPCNEGPIAMCVAEAMAEIDRVGAITAKSPFYRDLVEVRHKVGLSSDGLSHSLHGSRHLLLDDLLALFVLLSLETGLEIEVIKALRADCLKNPAGGYVEVEYCKLRARNAEWKRARVRDGGSSTPGGLLRLMKQWSEAARAHIGSERLFTYFCRGRLSDTVLPLQSARKLWVKRHAITGDDGRPLKLCLARLRKTHKAAWYRRTGGQLRRFAVGHSVEIAANHYADIPALRPIHEATIAAAMTDAVEDARRPIVLAPGAEAAILASPSDPHGLPIHAEVDVPALLAGDQDVWLASCASFYRSPFAAEGKACPVPFWGCLECRNGVITARKLPALMAFLDFVIGQRSILSDVDWRAKFSRVHYRITAQILPCFSKAEIEAAHAAAGQDSPLLYLPPETGMA